MLGWTFPLAAPYPNLTTDLNLCLQFVFILLFLRCLCVALYVVSMSCVYCVRDFISDALALELNRLEGFHNGLLDNMLRTISHDHG